QWSRRNFRSNGSRNSGYKDKNDDQKNCFHCKKPGHFIADCPEMSSKDRLKRNSSKKDHFKNRIKKSLMATWEDLDNLSDEDVEEDEANLALMASTESEAETNSEVESESDSENADEHELALQEFVHSNVNKSKVASMIYSVCRNNKEGLGYTYGKSYGQSSSSECLSKSPPPLYYTFVPESAHAKAKRFSEERVLRTSGLSNQQLRCWVWKESEPKTVQSKALKHSEPNTSESQPLKLSKPQIIYDSRTRRYNQPKQMYGNQQRFWNNKQSKLWVKNSYQSKQYFQKRNYSNPRGAPKVYQRNNVFKTNQIGPIGKWVPKSEIVYHSDLHAMKGYRICDECAEVRC
ncbi:serine/threonine protein kinase SRPK1, partial [Trifolium medium]|nr:serine/threonine protein kinase SRPK1 [Trifolium medium]